MSEVSGFDTQLKTFIGQSPFNKSLTWQGFIAKLHPCYIVFRHRS